MSHRERASDVAAQARDLTCLGDPCGAPVLHGVGGILSLTALAAALVVVGTSRGAVLPPAAQPVRSIAVPPFRMLENGPGDRFLGVGLADEIIARLNPLHSLVVRSANAVQFDAPTRDVVDYGRALGVEAVLDGSIQRSGEHLRVTADLVRVADRTSIWAGQFDETSGSLTIEDSISAKVVDALVLALSPGIGPSRGFARPECIGYTHSLRRAQTPQPPAVRVPDGRRGVDAAEVGKRTAVNDEFGLSFDRQLDRRVLLGRFRVRGDREQPITEQVLHGAVRRGDSLDASDRADCRCGRHLPSGGNDDVHCRAQRPTIDRTESRPRLSCGGERPERNQQCHERQSNGPVDEMMPADLRIHGSLSARLDAVLPMEPAQRG